MLKCNLCGFEAVNARSLATHLQTAHSMSTKEYTIQTMHGGICPTCAFCGAEVRYVSFSFKKYCKEHSFMAESAGGAIGGKNKKTRNKGLTKEQDSRNGS